MRLHCDFSLLTFLLFFQIDCEHFRRVAPLPVDVFLVETVANHFSLALANLARLLSVLQICQLVLRLHSLFVQGVGVEPAIDTAELFRWVVARLVHLQLTIIDQLGGEVVQVNHLGLLL